jgi:hypothetical protein
MLSSLWRRILEPPAGILGAEHEKGAEGLTM